MSTENDKEKKNSLGRLSIEIDRSAELEGAERALAEEKVKREEAEETLRLIAQKEFEAKCHSVGLNAETATPEDLKNELRKKAPRGGDTLSWSQNIGEEKEVRQKTDLASLLVDNTEEGLKSSIEFLNWKKKNGSESEKAEARALLSKAEKRQFSKNKTTLDAEFQGDIHSLTRHEIAIRENMTDEEKTKIEAYNAELRRKRANWVQKE
jgi:hypothetical protein